MNKKLKDYPEISIKPDSLQQKINFENIFGRSAPVQIEVGSGKATFLLAQSRAYPQTDFLGIEWASRYYRLAVDRLGRWGVKNVKLIRTDAAKFITEYVESDSVDCFHLYFPDPWHKRKHHKRRFINNTNFQQILRIVKPAGRIQIATDHEDYFQWMMKVIENFSDRVKQTDFIPAAGAEENELVGTNYERKFKNKRPTRKIALIKSR
jgi:tRNA (guanine-N7-)-methyltransferase